MPIYQGLEASQKLLVFDYSYSHTPPPHTVAIIYEDRFVTVLYVLSWDDSLMPQNPYHL